VLKNDRQRFIIANAFPDSNHIEYAAEQWASCEYL